MTRELASLFRALLYCPIYIARDARQFFVTVRRYYRYAAFRRTDIRCLLAYLLRNPDAICARFLKSHPADAVQTIYGETFFTTLEVIAEAVKLTGNDVIYDLGCGRGRSVFWFNAVYGCRAVGVEINPTFVRQARIIKKKARIDGVEFVLANLMDLDYNDATVIYLYGTAFSDAAITALASRFRSLAPGTRVVTVSYPLTSYTEEKLFELEKRIDAKFVWGDTWIYVQRKL